MRKPDDDLKIDIADLFGEELPSPSDAIEDASPSVKAAVAAPAPTVEKTPTETESQFKEWMDSRNTELESKVRELELRLQELKQQPPPPPPPPPAPVEVVASPSAPVAAPEPALAVDFNAPIAVPFAGPSIQDPSGEAAPSEPPAAAGPSDGVPDAQKAEELRRLQADYEFLMLYDEFRNILLHELKDLVGEKKTYTMLERTVEIARGKFPEIFRNANWDTAGNLLEDGSVDSQRVIENKNALDPPKADAAVDAALSGLLTLRFQAVEKGLGAGLRNKIRARMYQWITEKVNRAQKDGKDASFLKRLGSYVA
jgi:hypothetical protein